MGAWEALTQQRRDLIECPTSKSRVILYAMLTRAVIEGHNLEAADITGTSDPFVKLYYFPNGSSEATQEAQTKTVMKRLSPVWKEEFQFELGGDEDYIKFEVYDYDRFTSNDFLAQCQITIGKLKEGESHWLTLEPPPGKSSARGKILISGSIV